MDERPSPEAPKPRGRCLALHRLPPERKSVDLFRIALANIRFPATPEESVTLAEQAIEQAAAHGARIVCFPECFIPGYRIGKPVPPPDAVFLERAWSRVAAAAATGNITVVLGTERFAEGQLRISALVINSDGSIAGVQDKVQLDPSEDATFTPGVGRRLFHAGPLTFGIAICHEGFRYPETVRWAAQRGAHLVFHPHFHEAEPGAFRPTKFADPANTFHEKSALCRAAENTPATSPQLIAPAPARRPPQRSFAPTVRFSPISPTVKKVF